MVKVVVIVERVGIVDVVTGRRGHHSCFGISRKQCYKTYSYVTDILLPARQITFHMLIHSSLHKTV